MGNGKGGVEGWVAVVQPGRVIYELDGHPEGDGARGVPPRRRKLPVKTRFLDRSEQL